MNHSISRSVASKRMRELGASRPLAVRIALLAGWVLLAAFSSHALMGYGGQGLDDFFQKWVNDGIAIIATLACAERARRQRRERTAWLLVSLGIATWTAGNIYYTLVLIDLDPFPVPSVADGLWLSLYPPIAVALVLLLRSRVRMFPRSLWLDGVIGACAVASVAAAIVLEAVLQAGLHGTFAAITTNLAYPTADLILLGVMTGVVALSGWRVGRAWGYVTAALISFTVTDGLFLFQTATGSYSVGTIVDAGWLLAVLLFAEAAWQPIPETRTVIAHGHRMLVLPAVFSASALGVLLWGDVGEMNVVAITLAAITVAAVVVRMALAFLDVSIATDALELARRDAEQRSRVDALTGLFNRRHMSEVLTSEFERASREETTPALLLVDLDNFKHVNDAHGHVAGDAVLIEAARRLELTMRTYDCVARWGGEEYCAVVSSIESDSDLVQRADEVRRAISDHQFELPSGSLLTVTCSIGMARFDAGDFSTETLLQLADQALYAAKRGGRNRVCLIPGTRDLASVAKVSA